MGAYGTKRGWPSEEGVIQKWSLLEKVMVEYVESGYWLLTLALRLPSGLFGGKPVNS